MTYDLSTQYIGALEGEDGWYRVPMGQGVYLKLTPAEWAAWEGVALVPLPVTEEEAPYRARGFTDADIALCRGLLRAIEEQRAEVAV